MQVGAWLLASGSVVGIAVLVILAGVLADAGLSATIQAVLRRPEWARRRANERGPLRALLVGAYLCIVFAFAFAVISYAAGTSGYASDHNDAWFWAAAAAFLIVLGLSSFVVWWRVAGRPRHY